MRVKNLDRLAIPGTFEVLLRAGGKEIARRSFFQSTTPKRCSTCKKKGHVSFDFVVDIDRLQGALSIDVLVMRGGKEHRFPLSSCGNPTVNARLLLEA